MNASHWPRAVLFDLDGTLIDSAPDIHAAVDELLAANGFAPLPFDRVKAMIGHGTRKLVERAFAAVGVALDEKALDAKYDQMMPIYNSHLTRLTTLLPGVPETLAALAERGVAMGVVTNKPQAPTETVLAHFGIAGRFGAVLGGDYGLPRKPAPDMLLGALRILGSNPGSAAMVGDSESDIQSGRAAGMPTVAIAGGYTNVPPHELGANLVILQFVELPAALEQIRSAQPA